MTIPTFPDWLKQNKPDLLDEYGYDPEDFDWDAFEQWALLRYDQERVIDSPSSR